ncbi:LON peptidase substrate-binding domain-containing protein [Escherichia coli]
MVIPLFVGGKNPFAVWKRPWSRTKKFCWWPRRMRQPTSRRWRRSFTVGTVANILQMLKLPDGTVKVLVEGGQRARRDPDKATLCLRGPVHPLPSH